jgi:hypothetical protein
MRSWPEAESSSNARARGVERPYPPGYLAKVFRFAEPSAVGQDGSCLNREQHGY